MIGLFIPAQPHAWDFSGEEQRGLTRQHSEASPHRARLCTASAVPWELFVAILGKYTESGIRCSCQQCIRSCGYSFPRLGLSWAEGSNPKASGFASSVSLETMGCVAGGGWEGSGGVEEVGLVGAPRPGSSIRNLKKRFQLSLTPEF